MTSAYAKAERRANSGRGFGSEAGQGLVEGGLADLHAGGIGRGGFSPGAALAWAVVGIPIVWGIGITLSKAFILFR